LGACVISMLDNLKQTGVEFCSLHVVNRLYRVYMKGPLLFRSQNARSYNLERRENHVYKRRDSPFPKLVYRPGPPDFDRGRGFGPNASGLLRNAVCGRPKRPIDRPPPQESEAKLA
jgi:hypothetical protein